MQFVRMPRIAMDAVPWRLPDDAPPEVVAVLLSAPVLGATASPEVLANRLLAMFERAVCRKFPHTVVGCLAACVSFARIVTVPFPGAHRLAAPGPAPPLDAAGESTVDADNNAADGNAAAADSDSDDDDGDDGDGAAGAHELLAARVDLMPLCEHATDTAGTLLDSSQWHVGRLSPFAAAPSPHALGVDATQPSPALVVGSGGRRGLGAPAPDPRPPRSPPVPGTTGYKSAAPPDLVLCKTGGPEHRKPYAYLKRTYPYLF